LLELVERAGVLLHLVDINQENITMSYDIIRNELVKYGLEEKIEVIALSKCDSLTLEEIKQKQLILEKHTKKKIYAISSAAKQGITQVLRQLKKYIVV
jgi:GTPase